MAPRRIAALLASSGHGEASKAQRRTGRRPQAGRRNSEAHASDQAEAAQGHGRRAQGEARALQTEERDMTANSSGHQAHSWWSRHPANERAENFFATGFVVFKKAVQR